MSDSIHIANPIVNYRRLERDVAQSDNIARLKRMMVTSEQSQSMTSGLIAREANPSQISYILENLAEFNDARINRAQHLAREKKLLELPYAMSSKYWVLVPSDSPNSNDIRCSARAFETQAYLVMPKTSDEIYVVPSRYIATAHTPLVYRRGGNAVKFVKELLKHVQYNAAQPKRLKEDGVEQDPTTFENQLEDLSADEPPDPRMLVTYWFGDAAAANLFNGVADPQPSWVSEIPLDHVFYTLKDPIFSQPIHQNELPHIVEHDTKLLIEDLRMFAKSRNRNTFIISPSAAALEHRIKKEHMNISYRLNGLNKPSWQQCGVTIGTPGEPGWAFATWCPNTCKDQLAITRMRAETEEQVQILLMAALKAAKDRPSLTEGLSFRIGTKNLLNLFEKMQLDVDYSPQGTAYMRCHSFPGGEELTTAGSINIIDENGDIVPSDVEAEVIPCHWFTPQSYANGNG